MSDLPKRLRDYSRDDHERGCQGRHYDCSCGYDSKRDPLLEEAAARIEQLEAAIAIIRAKVLEEAAKVAEAFPARTHGNLATAPYAAAEQAAEEIATAIRALKENDDA